MFVLVLRIIFLSCVSSVYANHFRDPPPEVHPYGFANNKDYKIGDSMVISWDTSWNPISMVLWQWRTPANEPLLNRVPNIGHFEWTVGTKQDISSVTQFCLQISRIDSNPVETFTSRFFNILPRNGTSPSNQTGNSTFPITAQSPFPSTTSVLSKPSSPTGGGSNVPHVPTASPPSSMPDDQSHTQESQRYSSKQRLILGLSIGFGLAFPFAAAFVGWRYWRSSRVKPMIKEAPDMWEDSRDALKMRIELPIGPQTPRIRFEMADPTTLSNPRQPSVRHEMYAGSARALSSASWI